MLAFILWIQPLSTPTVIEQTAEEAFRDRSSIQFNPFSSQEQHKNPVRVKLLFAGEVTPIVFGQSNNTLGAMKRS